jgi:hypothetical protein
VILRTSRKVINRAIVNHPETDFVLSGVFRPAMLPTVNANPQADKCDAALIRASSLFMFFRLPVVRHRRRSAW